MTTEQTYPARLTRIRMDDIPRRTVVHAGAVTTAVATAGCAISGTSVENTSVPEEAYVGDPVTVEVTVSNAGFTGVERTITLTVDGQTVANRTLDIGARGETTLELTHRFDEPGTYDLTVGGIDAGSVVVEAPLSVAKARLRDGEIARGGATTVEATVQSRAATGVDGVVSVAVDDVPVGTVRVSLPPNGVSTVRPSVAPTAPGDHEVAVNDVVAGTLTVGDVWHQFGHGQGNAARIATGGPSTQPTTAWRTTLTEGVAAAPVVHDGTVYVGGGNPYGASGRGTLQAVDASTGKTRWATDTAGAVLGSPAVAAGRVVVGTTDGALRDVESPTDLSGHLTAYEPNGTGAWSLETDDPVTAPPTVRNQCVYVATVGGSVMAVDALDGTRRWRRSLDGGFLTSPAVAGDTVLVSGATDAVRALSVADGTDRWRHGMEPWITAPPAVADGTAYVTGYWPTLGESRGTLHAVDVGDGAVAWTATIPDTFVSGAAIGEGGLYAGVGISVWGFERGDGEVRWRSQDADAGSGGGLPAVTGDAVYAGVGRVNGGILYEFDPETGDTVWRLDIGSATTAMTVTETALYTSVGFGTVVAVR